MYLEPVQCCISALGTAISFYWNLKTAIRFGFGENRIPSEGKNRILNKKYQPFLEDSIELIPKLLIMCRFFCQQFYYWSVIN